MAAEKIYTGQLTLGFSEPIVEIYDNQYNFFRRVPDVAIVELPSRDGSINNTVDEVISDNKDGRQDMYAGVYVDSVTMEELVAKVLYPNVKERGRGLPQLRGMLNSTPEGQTSTYLENVQNKVDRLNDDAYKILRLSLEVAGIPKDQQLRKVDEIIEEVRTRRLNKENHTKVQKKIGTTALRDNQ